MDDWRDAAACKDENPMAWFSDDSFMQSIAKRICSECPVAKECLSEAMRRRERYGIWGGHDFGAKERNKKHRRVA